jgi:hypothetical protein
MGIEAARHAHQGASIGESLHVLARQAEPSQVARACNTEAPHRFEYFPFEGIFHGWASRLNYQVFNNIYLGIKNNLDR